MSLPTPYDDHFVGTVDISKSGSKSHVGASEAAIFKLKAICSVNPNYKITAYVWKAFAPNGSSLNLKTESNGVEFICPNIYCGCRLEVTVMVKLERIDQPQTKKKKENKRTNYVDLPKEEKQSYNFWENSNLIYPDISCLTKGINDILNQKHATIKTKIFLYPTCEQTASTDADWIKFFDQLLIKLNVTGCNGSYLMVEDLVSDEDSKILKLKNSRVIVKDNSLVVCYRIDKTGLLSKTSASQKKVSCHFKIKESKHHKTLGDYSQDFNFETIFVGLVQPLKFNVAQPVVVGTKDLKFIENNFSFCKFTEIDANYPNDREGKEPKDFTIFDEKGTPIQPINLIGGKRNVKIKLLEYTPKCTEHNNREARLSPYGKKDERKILQIDQNGSCNFDIVYRYTLSQIVSSNDIYKFIWPINQSHIQESILDINTCRHTCRIPIYFYPDVKWSLAFAISFENPLAYTYGNKQKEKVTARNVYAEAHNKAIQTGKDCKAMFRGDKVPFEFNLSLVTEYSLGEAKEKNEIGAKIIEKLHTFFSVLLELKSWADSIKELAGGKVKECSLIGDKPFSFEFMSPKLGANVSWYLTSVGSPPKVALEGEFSFTADPLIGVELTIDVLALGGKINPVVGTIMNVLNLGLKELGAQLFFDVKFFGYLEMTMDAVRFNSITGFSVGESQNLEGKLGVKVELVAKGNAKISVFGFKTEIEFDAELKGMAYFGGKVEFGVDKSGVYGDFSCKFSGLIIIGEISGSAGIFKKKKRLESKPFFKSDEKKLGRAYLIKI